MNTYDESTIDDLLVTLRETNKNLRTLKEQLQDNDRVASGKIHDLMDDLIRRGDAIKELKVAYDGRPIDGVRAVDAIIKMPAARKGYKIPVNKALLIKRIAAFPYENIDLTDISVIMRSMFTCDDQNDSEYVTTAEYAKMYHVSRQQIHYLIQKGKLDSIKDGRNRLIRRDAMYPVRRR